MIYNKKNIFVSSLRYFYRYLRIKIFIAFFISLLIGILDGFGMSMFLPLLQSFGSSAEINPESLGKLSFLLEIITSIGLPLNLLNVLLLLISFFILKGIINYFGWSFHIKLQQVFIRTVRLKLLEHLNNLDFSFYISSDIGRIQNTLSSEVERLANAFSHFLNTINYALFVIIYVGLAFMVDYTFAFLVTAGGLLTNILYQFVYKRTKESSVAFTSDSNIYQGFLMQYLSNYKYLKATGIINIYSDKIATIVKQIESTRKTIGIFGALLATAREPIMITIIAIVILSYSYLLNGSLAMVMISLLFFYRALVSLTLLQGYWNNFIAVSGSMDNMLDFEKIISSKHQDDGDFVVEKFQNNLECKNLHICLSNLPILKGINFKIIKNETIAIVGKTGSGKTTMVNLLAGLLRPDEGSILIDGIPIEKLKKSTWQRRIGYITQESVIFNDTIFNNVTMWAPKNELNKSRFNKTLEKTSLNIFVNSLKEKENSLLGTNGLNLSGGQRQRISIARELFKDIDILIMDEATSSLDSETEKTIQENIDILKGKYTIIIIAHRLSTIKNADRIIVMDNGKISQIGTYNELIVRGTDFKRMVDLQEL